MSISRNQPARSAYRGNRGRGRGASLGGSFSPPTRQMEHIASVSRSSGLEKDGDTLKEFKVQEEYRDFLQAKVKDVLTKYPRRPIETEQEVSARMNTQENVLILFRKLREGISSSRRSDLFALEVYETSLYLATLFESPKQSTPVIPHLVPSLYLASPQPHKNHLVTVIISLLHHLVSAYPSQGTFRQFFDTIPAELFPRTSSACQWISSIAKSLRTQNYASFGVLSSPSNISKLFKSTSDSDLSDTMESLSISSIDSQSLSRQALYTLIQSLRNKARLSNWGIVRSAYRELSSSCEETQLWLKHSLCLPSVVPYCRDTTVEQWLEQHIESGHTRRKEGVEGKWLIYKVR